MLYILLGILGLLLALLLIAVVRTLRIKAPDRAKCETVITQQELDTAAVKLAHRLGISISSPTCSAW